MRILLCGKKEILKCKLKLRSCIIQKKIINYDENAFKTKYLTETNINLHRTLNNDILESDSGK